MCKNVPKRTHSSDGVGHGEGGRVLTLGQEAVRLVQTEVVHLVAVDGQDLVP